MLIDKKVFIVPGKYYLDFQKLLFRKGCEWAAGGTETIFNFEHYENVAYFIDNNIITYEVFNCDYNKAYNKIKDESYTIHDYHYFDIKTIEVE